MSVASFGTSRSKLTTLGGANRKQSLRASDVRLLSLAVVVVAAEAIERRAGLQVDLGGGDRLDVRVGSARTVASPISAARAAVMGTSKWHR